VHHAIKPNQYSSSRQTTTSGLKFFADFLKKHRIAFKGAVERWILAVSICGYALDIFT
jgi:hypothetical protein